MSFRNWLKPRPERRLRGRGVEIGAHELPLRGIRPIYVDRFLEFADKPCRVDVLADCCALPFAAGALDYLVASHVLEHLGNPIGALAEWFRVVRPGGLLYLVVPDRRYTFDRHREPTPLGHLLEDFAQSTPDSDPTHIEDYARLREPGRIRDRAVLERELRAQSAAGQPLDLHHHVFEPAGLRSLLEAVRTHPKLRLNWELLDWRERYPAWRGDGILALLRVR